MRNFTLSLLLFLLAPFYLLAQLPAGDVAKYPLNDNALDAGSGGFNGTLTLAAGTTNRFGTANSAIQLTSGTSYGSLPVVVKDNFSLGFWFKTTMSAPAGSQWYSGSSLVDAEVCGVTNDWGIALINGGKVCFGVGNPDKTIISALNYNDGNWHYVIATRNKLGAGTSILYVDGSQVATTTGINRGTLTAPTIIGLGRNNCTGADYTGSLDDLIFYARTLSSAEATSLYNYTNTIILPVSWVYFSAAVQTNKILLQWQTGDLNENADFVVEHSADGEHFSTIGSVPAANNINANNSYTFEDISPVTGTNYYRIRQVNTDGTYSYSTIITAAFDNQGKQMGLLTNPVQNGTVVLENPALQPIREINIIDLSGRVILHKYVNASSASLSVSVSGISPGYYLIQVSSSQKNQSFPFVKGN